MARKNNELATTGETAVTKKKPRGGNSPVIGLNGYNLEPGDNAKILNVNVQLFNMEKIDLHDEIAVAERLTEYFNLYGEQDMKPTVAGMAMALGMTRQTLWAVTHDAPVGGKGNMTSLPPSCTDLIKKAYFILENMWETYMNSGKINPMAGVFLGVNNYGYKDVKRVDVAPAAPGNSDTDYDANAIRERYLPDSTSDSDSDGGSDSPSD